MGRVVEAEVKEIVATSLDAAAISPFLQTANVLVTECLGDAGLAEEVLAEIELWLAAHFVAIRDPEWQARQVDDLRIQRHARQAGRGLDATPYGQQVRLLDPTGRIAARMAQERRPWLFRAGAPSSGL